MQEFGSKFVVWKCYILYFFFQAEDGIRDLVRSRGLGDVYKRQWLHVATDALGRWADSGADVIVFMAEDEHGRRGVCLSLIHIRRLRRAN